MNRDEQEGKHTYEQLFIALSTKVEKVLIRFLLVFLLLLLCSQALLQIPLMREHLTRVEPLEGKPYADTRGLYQGVVSPFTQTDKARQVLHLPP
jgi:hypothetical protein